MPKLSAQAPNASSAPRAPPLNRISSSRFNIERSQSDRHSLSSLPSGASTAADASPAASDASPASTSGSSCFMKSGVMSMASSSSVPSRSYIRPVNLVGMGPRGLSSFFLNGFFLSFGGAGGPKSFVRAPPTPPPKVPPPPPPRSEEHTSELQSQSNLVCRLLLEKKKRNNKLE